MEQKPKTKRSTLIGNYEEGGYKDVYVDTKMNPLNIIWIRRSTDDNFQTGKIILSKLFRPIAGTSFFHKNLKLADSCMRVVETSPTFYQELVQLCITIIQVEPKNIDNILTENL